MMEFTLVALPAVGHMPAPWEAAKEAARVLYVAATRATRATQRLVMGVGGDGGFRQQLDCNLIKSIVYEYSIDIFCIGLYCSSHFPGIGWRTLLC